MQVRHCHIHLLALALFAVLASCAAPPQTTRPAGRVAYAGSSTVANFIRAAEPAYGAIEFRIDTAPESGGAEAELLAGRASLAGIARSPSPSTLEAGIEATLIGRDAIAVITHPALELEGLTTAQLTSIFTGQATNWNELGGPDLAIQPLIAGPESATHTTFRRIILRDAAFAGCRVVSPDASIAPEVIETPGAIGIISFSFLRSDPGLRTLSVDGQRPSVTNFEYPIARPLFLLSHRGDPVIESFLDWATGPLGQQIVLRKFVGIRIVGSVSGTEPVAATGTLVVTTDTDEVQDGGIPYYPHRPYVLLDRDGRQVRRVRNSHGINDEEPTVVVLAPGTYVVRTQTLSAGEIEFFVTIEPGMRTHVDVEQLLADRQ